MKHYKSWGWLNKQLHGFLCDSLKDRVTYFLTRYHKVHNAYGRASVRVEGRELVCFEWIESYNQEGDVYKHWKDTDAWDYDAPELREKWDSDCTYSETDFLHAATEYINMPAADALKSGNYIIKLLAIMDRRVGKRTLYELFNAGEYQSYPRWARQFYELRFESEGICKVKM